jgi:hypothetical protein
MYTGSATWINNPNDVHFRGDELTIIVHMYPNASAQATYADIIDYSHISGGNWVVQQDASNQRRFQLNWGKAPSGFEPTGVPPACPDRWHWWAVTKFASGSGFYSYDGQVVYEFSGKVSSIRYTGDEPIYIGIANGFTTRRFNGYLSDLRVYARGMQPWEIQDVIMRPYDDMLYGRPYWLAAAATAVTPPTIAPKAYHYLRTIGAA